MSRKIRPGTFKEEIPDEQILWRDRKRWLFFGLPWTFTRYDLTETKLRVSKGFFKRTEDDILLYRISDITFFQSFGERLNGLGTLCIISSDVSQPEAHIVHVKRPRKVKELMLQKIEAARKEKGVYASELIGGIAHARPPINHADQSEHEQSNPCQEREQLNAEHNH
jgi:hypothetical protein